MLKGTLLNNRFKIIDTIGIGGMAYVYKAYDTLLERNVAVKILKEDFARTEDFLNKFKLEATSAASLSDENIVGIYDVGSQEIDGTTTEYIVMEMIEGKTLKTIIEEEGPLSNEKIVYYARQIALALQAAHRKGVVHRDIKPANILINKEDKVKVTDFGIARVSSQATLTYTSSILGTVHYLSPEQAKGLPTDDRSDLYSLGVVLYEMATGDVPFDAETPVSIAIKHLQDEPKPISEINPAIDPNLEKIILKLLSKDVSTRYQSANELISNLDDYKNINIKVVNKPTQKIDRDKLKTNKVEYNSSPKRLESEQDKKKRFKPIWLLVPLLAALLIYLLSIFLSSYANRNKDKNLISVPNVYAYTESDAIARLSQAGLSPELLSERVNDTKIAEGLVIKQSIGPNEKVKPNTVVKLTISAGPKQVKVPRVVGFTLQLAKDELKAIGLNVENVTSEFSDKPKDTIISQDPVAYTKIEVGSPINLVVSKGPEVKKIKVPNILGQDQSTAINTLNSRDLIPGQITSEYSNQTAGTVISQSVNAGTEVDPKAAIDFVISMGPEPKPDPEPTTPTQPPTGGTNTGTEVTDKNFVFSIQAPEGSETFNVKIYTTQPKKELVFEQTFVTKDLENGTATAKVTAKSDSKFEILLNDKVANVEYE